MRYTDVKKLAKQYARIYNLHQDEVVRLLLSGDTYSLREREEILQAIAYELDDLERKSDEFIDRNVEKMYKLGAMDAVKGLAFLGIASMIFNSNHREAIENIADTAKVAANESISGIFKSSSRILGQATEERLKALISEGKITSATRKEMVYKITEALKEQRVFILDSSGRRWDVETYAEMFVETNSMKAYNEGVVNQVLERGQDLVYVTSYPTCECDICLKWEGKVLSISGNNPNVPSVQDAKDDGLWHPRCRHRTRPVPSSEAAKYE
jgi:hypothetical protein